MDYSCTIIKRSQWMRRWKWAMLLLLMAPVVYGQGLAPVLQVHLKNQAVQQLEPSKIASVVFGDEMVVTLSSGEKRRYVTTDVDSMTFAKVPETELYEAVDLGLTVKWAPFNIGATSPEEYGDLFAWGETAPKSSYTEENYTYLNNGQYEIIGTNICGTKYDAARQRWGGQWRLPTRSEIADLTNKCTWTQETLNGVAGYRVTGTNGNSIFLPAAGYQDGTERKEEGTGGFYWSGNIDRSMTSAAFNLNFRGYDAQWSANRCYGFSVRAVK